MPKTKHPKEVQKEAEAILSAKHFSLGNNDDRNTAQASMTYRVDTTDGVPLGSHGETRGFAKTMAPKGIEPKGAGRLYLDSTKAKGDCGLITRQVASHQTDKLLGLNVIAEERFGVDSQGKVIGVSIQADGSNIVSNKGVLQVDCRDPRIQRGLSDLQVVDFINGETDRHAGNIFINPATGKVTGIDNDLSFPEKDIRKVGGDALDKIVGMPGTVHQDTAKKILAADPDELRTRLSASPPKKGPAPLSQASIDGAVNRLMELQQELRNPTGAIKVVKAFDDTTYKADLDVMEAGFKSEQTTFIASYIKDFQVKSTKEFIQMSDEDRAKLPNRLFQKIDTVQKKSYLATVELELAKNKMLHGRDQVLAEHTQAPPAPKLPQAVYERKLADGYAKMSKDEQKSFDKDLERLNKLEGQLADKEKHLLEPSFTDKFNALTKGGMDAVMNRKRDHASDIADEIASLRTKLEDKADTALGLTPALVGHTQSMSDSGATESLEKPRTHDLSDGDNAHSTSDDDTSQVLIMDESDISVDENEPESLVQTDSLHVPSPSEKNDQHPSDPELESSESVRETLRKTGAVQRAKTQLGLDTEPHHRVREDVGGKEPLDKTGHGQNQTKVSQHH
jgi:hypothetical protein